MNKPDKGDLMYPAGQNVVIVEGEILPIGPKTISPSEIVARIKEILASPYTGHKAGLIGMSLLDAAIQSAAEDAAEGNIESLEKLLNRVMGKPTQTVVTATGTLTEFLDGIARAESKTPTDTNPFSD